MRLAAAALLAMAATPAVAPVMLTARERAAARTINADLLRGHIRFLSSDLLGGRGPATTGDRLAQQYIAAQMEAAGLQPGAPGGGWLQPLDIVGITSHNPDVATVSKGGDKVDLKYKDDYIAFSGVTAPEARLDNAEVVFVGYGIVAPEYQWDDYKGADLKGKVLLMMNNDPASDPKLFGGKTRQYYGRWTYKYEIAARKGAAGAIIIHTEPSAGYKWQVVTSSWSGENFTLPLAGMIVASFLHTQKDQPSPPAPHYGVNDNFALDQASIFLAGGFGSHFGAFSQFTYDGVGRSFAWDQLDVRATTRTALFGMVRGSIRRSGSGRTHPDTKRPPVARRSRPVARSMTDRITSSADQPRSRVRSWQSPREPEEPGRPEP